MFTGIVEEVGVVAKISDIGMTVRATKVTEDLKLGDSIAVNGACLTAVSFDRTEFSVDLSPETMRRTSLDQLSVGGPVNLERALLASDRMGGHIMQGHVDGTGRVMSTKRDGDSTVFRIRVPKRLQRYIVEKGFVAVDGISLTVVKRGASSFTLAVIPYTLKNTNLASLSVGDRVNLEADILAKYVESLLDR
ncbi:MAG: riboflavin synthase [Chloroflexi bacterium]|nr:riboflavin synthase [Dehalococcoidia bacterium]PCJ75935.1 MAG: riboflavin synthase [Dehalococcoidia bacterium]PKB81050.1 MAG: riboflavin synthase [SAR202 cluster bacterium MP-SInd-SRR3963457-G1]RUA19986.1 MAG: riboflavin synthase [Chloroflexota bacterium]RUA31944.1 MAG: riboflavin synthase [Chloroflexota bacterium]